jgi:hypothetical protein
MKPGQTILDALTTDPDFASIAMRAGKLDDLMKLGKLQRQGKMFDQFGQQGAGNNFAIEGIEFDSDGNVSYNYGGNKIQKMGSMMVTTNAAGEIVSETPITDYQMVEVDDGRGGTIRMPVNVVPQSSSSLSGIGSPGQAMPWGRSGGIQTSPAESTLAPQRQGGIQTKVPYSEQEIPPAELINYVDPDGNLPNPGVTYGDVGETIFRKTEGEKRALSADESGRLTAMRQSYDNLPELQSLVYNEDGSVNRMNLITGAIGTGVPFTQGRQFVSVLENTIAGTVYARTGAQASPEEIAQVAKEFAPSALDDDATIKSKMQRLEAFVNGYWEKVTLPPTLSRLYKQTRGNPFNEKLAMMGRDLSTGVDLSENWDPAKYGFPSGTPAPPKGTVAVY